MVGYATGRAIPDQRSPNTALSAQIRAHIDRIASSSSGKPFEQAARRFDALPLYEGWNGWGLLTAQGDVIEETDEGAASPAAEPMRTMYLVAGAETYPELKAMLPVRPVASADCKRCNGTGWMHLEAKQGRVRCAECRALGWVEAGDEPMSLRPGPTMLAVAGAVVTWLTVLFVTLHLAYSTNAYWLLRQELGLFGAALLGLVATLLFLFFRSQIKMVGRVVLGLIALSAFITSAFLGAISVACANGNCL
jgi:hypothetical protein